MRVILADKIGFCFGVKRAVKMADSALEKKRPIYSLGSIIHNRQVVEALSKKGLKVVRDIRRIKGGTVVISSHGISPRIAGAILKNGAKIIDTTCPFVLKAQSIARRLGDEGRTVIIVGDIDHPEIRALVDFVPKKAVVVKDVGEARRLKLRRGERISIISQTTQATNNFLGVVNAILERRPGKAKVCDTICKDAGERQKLARALASRVDLMLVIGGYNSANTRRLYEVCKKILRPSYLIETEGDLNRRWFRGVSVIGITSGASTPEWVIKRVLDKLKKW